MALKTLLRKIIWEIRKEFLYKDKKPSLYQEKFIPNISTPVAKASKETNLRLNLLITSMNKTDVFAGIKTAVDFFIGFVDYMKCDCRIIVMDKTVDINDLYKAEGFEFDETGEKENRAIIDLTNREKTLLIRESDTFLATFWDTAYTILSLKDWFSQQFKKTMRVIYLIQDFEPGFYNWSSHYLLAESTYKNKRNVYAVFNSKSLKDFFEKNSYDFCKTYYFEPKLNDKLKEILIEKTKSGEKIKRKNQILIYGRLSKPRNGFELIMMALEEWYKKDSNAKNWTVFSAGENFETFKTPSNLTIHCLGKLTIEEYAKFLLETKIGISIMVSPHPSYPPLEMATFGIKVITNTFANKDLSDFSENIISLEKVTIKDLARTLSELTKTPFETKIKTDQYLDDSIEQWTEIYKSLKKELEI